MNLLNNAIYNDDLKKVINIIENTSKLRNSTILITGATGLVCSSVVDLLNLLNKRDKLNLRIVVAGRNENKARSRFNIDDSNIIFLNYDASKTFNYDQVVDFIICGASNANPSLYTHKPVETIDTTVLGVKHLLEYTKANGVKRFLYISSGEVYGVINECRSLTENDFGSIETLNARSSYAISKKLAEAYCKSYQIEYGIDFIIVRPCHVYGPTASNNDCRVSSFFAYNAAKGEELVLKSSGLQIRSYCYCIDCAAAIIIALINGKNGEAYNISNNKITTIKELSEILSSEGNVKLSYAIPKNTEKISFNPMSNSSLDNTKIKQIGYRESFTIREGLSHTVKILKEML